MLDQKLIRENPTSVEENLSLRGKVYNISHIHELTVKKKEIDIEISSLQSESKKLSKLIGQEISKCQNNDSPELNNLKKKGKIIVFTNGCFDLLHVGHIRYLAQAKKLGNFLIIGLNSDSSVKELKGEDRPINSFEDRATLLSAIKSVDLVIMFEEQTPENLIKDIVPDILVKGGDYNIEDIVGYQTVIQNGGQVKTLSFYDGYSSTNYINKIKKH